jgi:DNA-binding beta-propeller fold protein YncE
MKTMQCGSGNFVYEYIERWGNLPEGWEFGDSPGLAVDSENRLFVFNRSTNPVIVLDDQGNFAKSWGHGKFKRPHGIYISPDGYVFCVDDQGHSVTKFTPEGHPIMVIETSNHPADTGYQIGDLRSVIRSGPPFNHPTDLCRSSDGSFYVTDGYGNARVHMFSEGGELLFSWGEPGADAGQFVLPHGVCVDKNGRVYIADRENLRIQIFDPDGNYLSEWKNVWCPSSLCLDQDENLYVAELGLIMQGKPGHKTIVRDAPRPRITVRNLNGEILSEWGAKDPEGEGIFFAPHGIAVDSKGNIYVGEACISYSGGMAPPDRWKVHKYMRI